MLVAFGRSNLIEKAKQQPDKVKQVIDKVKAEGIRSTYEAVKSKLDEPIQLGYSSAGTVVSVGSGVLGIHPGDRVISNGPHAEYVVAPSNLCAKIPDAVSFEEASFTVIASIALEGIRLSDVKLGETVMVTGLGLIGILCVQLLRAQGCLVLGCDYDPHKCALAEEFGARTVCLADGGDPVGLGLHATKGYGVDAVLITASTASSDPIHQAAEMSRPRGRLILVGVTGLDLRRDLFYKKELTFQVSCSYGPGRYDPNYEGRGLDYPYGLVRWTAERNFQAVLACIANGSLNVGKLIQEHHAFSAVADVYSKLGSSLGVVLNYPGSIDASAPSQTVSVVSGQAAPQTKGVLGIIGAGNFTRRVLLPMVRASGARVKTIASKNGVNGSLAAQKFGIESSTTDYEVIFSDPEIDTVLVTTQHASHAHLVKRGLASGKRVFVEKPLCISMEELDDLLAAYNSCESPFVMVGFNRRFSPLVHRMRKLVSAQKDVKCIVYTVNAGSVPRDVWVQDPVAGGGRIIGEGCHFIDLCRYLVDAPIVSAHGTFVRGSADGVDSDKGTLTMTFGDGSIATVHYFANGSSRVSKERIEVFCGEAILALDNFRSLTGHGWPGFKGERSTMAKGHKEEMMRLLEAVRQGTGEPVPFSEAVEATRVTLEWSGL